MTDKPLQDRIALITGANRGIGHAVALGLAEAGAHVIAIARKDEALEKLDDEINALGGTATLVPLDLTDGAGIDRVGGAIAERWGKLDIFIGNAGILGPVSPLTHITPDKWAELLAVNLTANWRFLRTLDPLLQASDAGRVVLVSSGSAGANKPYWGGYATTKSALNEMGLTYAAETEKTNLRVNLINPGATRTDMRAAAMPGEDPMTLPAPEDLVPLFLELVDPAYTETGQYVHFPEWRKAKN